MSFFLTNLFTGIGLSMDAFSLAIIYGTLGMSKRKIKQASLTVGIYHFFMPLFGYFLGDMFLAKMPFQKELLVGSIFLIIAVEMLLSLKKEEKPTLLTNIVAILFFGLTVSIDSFSVGLGFGTMEMNMLLPSLMYAVISATFTYLGLTLGKKLGEKIGTVANVIGSIILIILSFYYFFLV